MPSVLSRKPKSIQGSRLKSQLIKLTDEHSRVVMHNHEKARIVNAKLKLVKSKFLLHEGIATAEKTLQTMQAKRSELLRTTKTLVRKDHPTIIIKKSGAELKRDSMKVTETSLLITGKKQFIRHLNKRLDAIS